MPCFEVFANGVELPLIVHDEIFHLEGNVTFPTGVLNFFIEMKVEAFLAMIKETCKIIPIFEPNTTPTIESSDEGTKVEEILCDALEACKT
jgi:hypothetical protein